MGLTSSYLAGGSGAQECSVINNDQPSTSVRDQLLG